MTERMRARLRLVVSNGKRIRPAKQEQEHADLPWVDVLAKIEALRKQRRDEPLEGDKQ